MSRQAFDLVSWYKGAYDGLCSYDREILRLQLKFASSTLVRGEPESDKKSLQRIFGKLKELAGDDNLTRSLEGLYVAQPDAFDPLKDDFMESRERNRSDAKRETCKEMVFYAGRQFGAVYALLLIRTFWTKEVSTHLLTNYVAGRIIRFIGTDAMGKRRLYHRELEEWWESPIIWSGYSKIPASTAESDNFSAESPADPRRQPDRPLRALGRDQAVYHRPRQRTADERGAGDCGASAARHHRDAAGAVDPTQSVSDRMRITATLNPKEISPEHLGAGNPRFPDNMTLEVPFPDPVVRSGSGPTGSIGPYGYAQSSFTPDPSTGSPFLLAANGAANSWRTQARAPVVAPIGVETMFFLSLLHTMEDRGIREDVLFRGFQPQLRLHRNGCSHPVSIDEFPNIPHFCSDQQILRHTIGCCLQYGLVAVDVAPDGDRVYCLKISCPDIGSCPQEVSTAVVAYAAFIYPRADVMDPFFQAVGRYLLPMIERLWADISHEYIRTLPLSVWESFVDASLSASKLTAPDHAERVLASLGNMRHEETPSYLRVMLGYQESVVARSQGAFRYSDQVLTNLVREYKGCPELTQDNRLYCAYQRLLMSRAENYLMRNEFKEASAIALACLPAAPATMLELSSVRKKNTLIGRIERYRGEFETSRNYLETCLRERGGNSSHRHITHHLADVCCELGDTERVKELTLDKVENLRKAQEQGSKAFRRLAAPLADAYLVRRDFDLGRITLNELLGVYEAMEKRDVTDELGHLRAAIGLFRVNWLEQRLPEADQALSRVEDLAQTYGYDTPGYYSSFLKFCRCLLSLACEQRRYHIPGVATYFLTKEVADGWGVRQPKNATC